MKLKTITLALGLCFVAAIVASASIPQGSSHMGTWKLNETKTKLAAGAPKNHTVVYEAAGDNIKVTVDGVDRDGKPVHHEWTGKFDGKDYAVTGDATSDMRSYKMIDERTVEFTAKKDGNVTLTGRVMVSADGKTRTVTTSSMDAQGKKMETTAIYDKQ
jgi:hypothetical protein